MYAHTEGKYDFKKCAFCLLFILDKRVFFFFFDLGNFFFSSVIPVICPSAAKFTEAIK